MRDKLLAWLDAGCPHYQFDMTWGLAIITEPECGTVCCIAGYVAEPDTNTSSDWELIQQLALDALGLPEISYSFDPELAPVSCKPAQAAIAARFAFANPHHPNPWEALDDA